LAADNEGFELKPLWASRGIGAGVGAAIGAGVTSGLKLPVVAGIAGGGAIGFGIGGILNKHKQAENYIQRKKLKNTSTIKVIENMEKHTPFETRSTEE
jgi:hypothetical protein